MTETMPSMNHAAVFFLNPVPPVFIAGAGIVLGIVLFFLFREFSVPAKRRQRAILGGFRGLLLALFCVILLDPHRHELHEAEWVGVLVDSSASMNVQDEPDSPSRFERVKDYLLQDPGWQELEQLLLRKRYTFGDKLSERASFKTLAAEDRSSRLLGALKELEHRYKDDANLIGWIVFTDAAATDIREDEIPTLGKFSIPWILMTLGREKEIPNLRMLAPEIADRVWVGEEVRLKVRWLTRGLPDSSTRLSVRLNGRTLESREVSVQKGFEEILLRLAEPGRFALDLELLPLSSEGSPSDNSVRVWLEAFPRHIRVFYAESYYQSKNLLKEALEEDTSFKVDFATSLIGFAKERSVPFFKDRLYGFPRTREELFQYDVIILSDVKRNLFAAAQMEWLEELVRTEGGVLVMIGGMDSFGDGGYVGTPVENMLPVEISEEYKKDAFIAARGTVENLFRPVLAPGNEAHPLLLLTPKEEENIREWKNIPLLGGYNYVGRLKPGAENLLLHPSDQSTFGPRIILAAQPYGLGKTIAFTSDVTHNWGQWFMEWRDEEGRWLFAQFWQNALKWAAEGRVRRTLSPMRIRFQPPLLTPEDPPVFSLFLGESRTEAHGKKLTVSIHHAEEIVQSREFLLSADQEEIQWQLSPLEPGDYLFKAVYQRSGLPLLTEEFSFAVQNSRIESDHLKANHTLAQKLASATGGIYWTFDERAHFDKAMSQLRKKHLRHHAAPLWHQLWVYLVFLSLLATDWFLRKKWGLE